MNGFVDFFNRFDHKSNAAQLVASALGDLLSSIPYDEGIWILPVKLQGDGRFFVVGHKENEEVVKKIMVNGIASWAQRKRRYKNKQKLIEKFKKACSK